MIISQVGDDQEDVLRYKVEAMPLYFGMYLYFPHNYLQQASASTRTTFIIYFFVIHHFTSCFTFFLFFSFFHVDASSNHCSASLKPYFWIRVLNQISFLF